MAHWRNTCHPSPETCFQTLRTHINLGTAACIDNSSIPMGKQETEMEDSLEAQKPNCVVHRDAINKDILSNTR